MASNITELTSAETVFLSELYLKGDKVEVSYDLLTVTIDGVVQGTFENMKSVYSAEWTASQDAITKSSAQFGGFQYDGVACSTTSNDLMSITATRVAMEGSPGQTNVPIKFSNGNTLTIDDDADLATFLAAWYVAWDNSGAIGYSYSPSDF